MKNILLGFLILIVVGFVTSCATVAVTGRSQLNLVPNSELIPMATTQYKDIITKGPLSTNVAKTQMVRDVGIKIQKAVEEYMSSNGKSSELNGFEWEFNLIEDTSTVNAWCMPGGKVAFYSAILPICKDENGIATVMGHEVAHAIANHGRERMSQQMVAQVGLSAFSSLLGNSPAMAQQLLLQAVGAGTTIGMLKFSRSHESEADHMGLIFMAIAGYDPSQAAEFWKRMSAMSGGAKPPEFLSTHPSDETRIKDIEVWLPEALKYYKK